MGTALACKISTKEKILEKLNEQQRLPVIDYEGASIILAGAGSGKTATIVARTAYMIEDGIPASQILLFTFTRKGANEIKDRVMANIGAKAKGVTVGTYHSFCCRLLRKHIESLNGPWTRKFSIFDADDCEALIKEIVKDDDRIDMKPGAILSIISGWKEKMMTPQEALTEAQGLDDEMGAAVADIYKIYAAKLRELNAVDFDDLIFLTIKLFEQCPDIKKKINNRYHYITADESQDSSPRDLELIYHLGGTLMNICLVGDDWQSIYGFRGSDISSFFYFVKEFELKKFYLERNYRSTKTIVNASKAVIAKNHDQFKKDVFSENADGRPITLYTMPNEEGEANRVTQIVKALNHHGIALNDIAILYRLSYLSRKVEDSFLANGIEYRMLSGTPFYSRKEIKDIMAYLRFVINPNDQLAFERAITRPKRGIGEKTLLKIVTCFYGVDYDMISLQRMKDVLESGAVKGKTKKSFENFVAIVEELNEQRDVLPPKEMVELVLTTTGYLEFLKNEDKESYDDRLGNIKELCEIASKYDSLEDFVGNMAVNEADAEKEEEGPDNKINMMTIHGSKGLEFKAVIVIGCNQGTLPHYKAVMEGNIEEERRLFYVAMTRAKELLFLTRPKTTFVRGVPMNQSPSVFLREIGSKHLREL